MTEEKKSKWDIFFVLFMFCYHIALMGGFLYFILMVDTATRYQLDSIWINVSLFGMTGACTYCLRALYTHYSVKKDWHNRWVIWHIIRPFVGIVCGVVSLLFVKTGLLIFSTDSNELNNYAIYSLAFIAGLNVMNFIKKIETTFEELAGIKPTHETDGVN